MNSRSLTLKGGHTLLYDAADAELVEPFNWFAAKRRNTYYAVRNLPNKGGSSYLHRELMGVAPGVQVDHRNGNGLDNTRRNLRAASQSQNSANQRTRRNNTSGVKGVSWHAARQKWHAYVNKGGKRRNLGMFEHLEDAKTARARAASALFGDYVHPNER